MGGRPTGVMQGDARFIDNYFDMSNGTPVRGSWNQGRGTWNEGTEWVYVDDPVDNVRSTNGLMDEPVQGAGKSVDEMRDLEQRLGRVRADEIRSKMPKKANQWSAYDGTVASPTEVDK